MSLYIVVWGVLCLFTFKGAIARESRIAGRTAFWLCFLVLTALLALRYGQGTDFFAYQYYYYQMSDTAIQVPVEDVHGEIGYQLLTNLFRLLHLPFEAWITFLSLVQMGCLLRFLRRYHIDCVFALLMAVPTLYFTYFASGIRQGTVMALFLGVLFPLLEKNKTLPFVAGTVLCTLFHGAAIVFLAALVARKIHRVSTLQVLTVTAWLTGALIASPPAQSLIASADIWAIRYYLRASGISMAAAAERLLFLILVTWLYFQLKKLGRDSAVFTLAYRCYLMGMALYGLLLCNSTTASRMASTIRYVEILLLVYAVRQMTRFSRYLLTVALIALQSFMMLKNLQTAIDQGDYLPQVTLTTFPYVSVFDEDAIYKYREIPTIFLNTPGRQA